MSDAAAKQEEKKPDGKQPGAKQPDGKAPVEAKPADAKPAEQWAATPKADPALARVDREFKYTRPLFGCRIDPRGRYVLTGALNNLVQRWDLETGKLTTLAGHDSWVRTMALSTDGDTAFTGGYDGRIIAWDIMAAEPKPRWTIELHHGWVRGLSLSPDGKTLASGGNDNLVKLWSTADGAAQAELSGHASHVYAVGYHASGTLASGDLKGLVKEWDTSTHKPKRELSAAEAMNKFDKVFEADIGGTRGMAFSRDGKFLAASGITNVQNAFAGIGNPIVVLFDWESGKIKQQFVSKDKLQGVGWGVVQHPDGFWIGAQGGNGGNGHLLFWKDSDPNEFFKLKLASQARDVDLHPDGLRLAVAHADNTLRIYSMTAKPKA